MLLGDYFVNIAVQLGLPVNSEVIRVLEREESFGAVIVSRFILPGSDLPTQWKGLTGLATRQKNLSKFDLKLELMGSSEVRCEANDGANFSSNSLVGKCNIGLLVVRSCCNFLTGGQHLAKNLQYIQSIMRLFPKRRLGKVVLISEFSELRVESFWSGSGRLVVMQVPGTVLRHGRCRRPIWLELCAVKEVCICYKYSCKRPGVLQNNRVRPLQLYLRRRHWSINAGPLILGAWLLYLL